VRGSIPQRPTIPNLGTQSNLGIFQLAYDLKHLPHTCQYDDKDLRRNLIWLEMHLAAPGILRSPEHYRAICWFKDSAREPLKRIWSIKNLLDRYGYWVEVVKTTNPGRIIYQDGWQIAAKPLR